MLQGISAIAGIVSILCYMMFTNAQSVIGIVCLVGLCLFGLGAIVAFVYGWIKAGEWGTVPVMGVWTGCIVLNIILAIVQATQGM